MTACLLYAKIHKNKAENLLHLMLYFSEKDILSKKRMQSFPACAILIDNFREFSHRDEKE